MRPEIALLVLLPISSFFFVRPAASHCAPRTSPYAVPVNYSSHSSFPPTIAPSPPPPKSSPSPKASPPRESPPTAPDAGPSSLGSIDGAVAAVCGHTSHPDLCVSSIRSLSPLSTGSLDVAALLKLEMQAIRTRLAPARSAASKLLAGAGGDVSLKSIMEACLSQYDDVPYALDSALSAIDARDRGTLNSMLSAVLSDVETCEQGFEDFERDSLMAIYDEPLSQLASNCLAISDLL